MFCASATQIRSRQTLSLCLCVSVSLCLNLSLSPSPGRDRHGLDRGGSLWKRDGEERCLTCPRKHVQEAVDCCKAWQASGDAGAGQLNPRVVRGSVLEQRVVRNCARTPASVQALSTAYLPSPSSAPPIAITPTLCFASQPEHRRATDEGGMEQEILQAEWSGMGCSLVPVGMPPTK